ncbi:hypothetical protein ACHWQZ_G017991 [Mnemiopsis leidyi]
MATSSNAQLISTIQQVEITSQVIMKITRHCHHELEKQLDPHVNGVLLGLINENKHVLEVTHCFPLMNSDTDEGMEINREYMLEMERSLRQVNIDYQQVGFYQSTYLNTHCDRNFLDSVFDYLEEMNEAIALIYDPLKTKLGNLSIRAFKLSAPAFKLYKEDKEFTAEMLRENSLTYENLFVEIPVVIKNSSLTNVLLCELDSVQDNTSFFTLPTSSYLEKSMQLLLGGLDEINQDLQKINNHQRNVYKQQTAIMKYIQDQKEKNDARVKDGLKPLPEEDVSKIFKDFAPVGRLESLLSSNRIASHCDMIEDHVRSGIGKLYLADSFMS